MLKSKIWHYAEKNEFSESNSQIDVWLECKKKVIFFPILFFSITQSFT